MNSLQPQRSRIDCIKTLLWPEMKQDMSAVLSMGNARERNNILARGSRFIGYFENDMRNGPGTMILPDGTVYRGYFKDDKLVYTERVYQPVILTR